MNKPGKPEPTGGLRHLIASTLYSLQGLRRMLRETAFRHELSFCAVLLILSAALGATLIEITVALVLALILLAIEALNTAIEEIVDHLAPNYQDFAKHAKDTASFAVFCLISGNLIYNVVVLATHLLRRW